MSAHGQLVKIWMALAKHTKRGARNRAKLEAYLSGPEFLDALHALDPARRLLALQAVAQAFDRLAAPPAEQSIRLVWTEPMRERLRQAARRAPNDRALARELGLPLTKAKAMRHKLCGPKCAPHITQIGALRLAA